MLVGMAALIQGGREHKGLKWTVIDCSEMPIGVPYSLGFRLSRTRVSLPMNGAM